MKWFKHLTASGHDPDIGAIMDEFGTQGYFLFFRTIEIMAMEFDVKNPGKNRFNFQWFLSQFPRNIGEKKIKKFLNFTANNTKKKRILYQINGKNIFLNCPKLKDLTDEYTAKTIAKKSGQVSGQNQESVGSKSEKNPSHRIRSKNKNLSKDKCTDIDFTLTDLLINGILSNDGKAKVPEKGTQGYFNWANQARLMREADNRSPREIEMLIRFSCEDEFWRSNILSMGKLREKATQLLLKAERFKPNNLGAVSSKPKTKREEELGLLLEETTEDVYSKYKDQLSNEEIKVKIKDARAKVTREFWGET